MNLRQAEPKDIDFLIESIIEAEKSNTCKLSYCTLFDFTEAEVRIKLKEILEEDIPGQELCISGFLIAEENNEPIAACCSWIEGKDGSISKINKANLLLWYFGKEKLEEARRKYVFVNELNFEREKKTLQIESVYTKPDFRGRGISGKLIVAHIEKQMSKNPGLKKVQIIVADTNESATKAYQKMGFKIINRKYTNHPEALILLPSNTRIQMELCCYKEIYLVGRQAESSTGSD